VADQLEWSPHQERVSKKKTPAMNRRESDGVARLFTVHDACQMQRHLLLHRQLDAMYVCVYELTGALCRWTRRRVGCLQYYVMRPCRSGYVMYGQLWGHVNFWKCCCCLASEHISARRWLSVWGAVNHCQRRNIRRVLCQRWAPVLTRHGTPGRQARLRLHQAAADGRERQQPVSVVLKSMPQRDGANAASASVAVGGPQLEGAWPLSCGQHTPGGRPKISRSGPARE